MASARKRKALNTLQDQFELTTAGKMAAYVDTCPADAPPPSVWVDLPATLTAEHRKQEQLELLQRAADRIATSDDPGAVAEELRATLSPAPAAAITDDAEPETGITVAIEPFGAWLLKQKDRKGWISDLAKWAKSDARFPKSGTAEDVRKRLTEIMAEGDAFEALDDAELDWSSY